MGSVCRFGGEQVGHLYGFSQASCDAGIHKVLCTVVGRDKVRRACVVVVCGDLNE